MEAKFHCEALHVAEWDFSGSAPELMWQFGEEASQGWLEWISGQKKVQWIAKADPSNTRLALLSDNQTVRIYNIQVSTWAIRKCDCGLAPSNCRLMAAHEGEYACVYARSNNLPAKNL